MMIKDRLTIPLFVLLFSNVIGARSLNTSPQTSHMPIMELPQLKTKPQKTWFKDPVKYMIGGALLVSGIDVGGAVLSKKTVTSESPIGSAVIGLCFGLVASRIVAWWHNKKIDAERQVDHSSLSTTINSAESNEKSSPPINRSTNSNLKPDWPY